MAYEDLIKDTSQSFENGNYFIVRITDLDVNQAYPVQFRWKNKDGTFSIWGAAKILSTPGESDPATPRLQSANVVGGAGYLSVTWDGKNSSGADLTNIDRVDIYIDNTPFDGTKPVDNFKTAGTKTFVAPAGAYTVTLVAVSKLGTLSPTSAAITKTVTSVSTPIATPEDPSAPTITTGLASIVVSWNGKNSEGNNFTTGSFAGAKVYIGTSSTFTPSADNWVHSLNFANGTNQVSIGVGTVINKTSGATLQYGTPYYIKLRTINAEGTETSTAIASSPTNVTVDKLPASEIKTGVLAADASITAGASSGARVVMSGASSPFIIYGTDGTTKLLEFIGGSTGTLAITGSSTFSGNIAVGSGNSIFKAEPLTGMWLGNASEPSAPFSVSVNGAIRATSGTIGGWYLGSSTLQNASSNPTLRLNTSGIIVGATSSSYIDIAPDSITHRNSNGTSSGKFTLTTGSSPSLTINGSVTASTFSLSGSNGDSWSSSGAFQFGGSSGIKYSGSGNLTIGSSGNTVTVNTSTGAVTVANITATQFSIDSNNYWNSSGFKVGNGSNRLEFVSSTGALTVTGQIDRGSNNYWNDSGFKVGNGTNKLEFVSATGNMALTGTIYADSGSFGGTITSASNITAGGTLSGSDIEIANDTLSNRVKTSYPRSTGPSGYGPFSVLGVNGIAMVSVNTSGVVSSWYPYIDAESDLGVVSPNQYYWRNLRYTGSLIKPSDARVKTDIENSDLGLDFINLLRPVKYKRVTVRKVPLTDENGNIVLDEDGEAILETKPAEIGERDHYGFIAQEVKAALDQVGVGDKFTGWVLNDVNDPDSFQGLAYEKFISPLAKAVQELSSSIDALKLRLDALEG